MLKTRVIPCLLLSKGGLVKTVKFSKPKYIGDPINAVRIFNDKEVDELVFLDIDATANNLSPNFELLERISSEAFMPFSYGGGIKSLDHAKKIFALPGIYHKIRLFVIKNTPIAIYASMLVKNIFISFL